MYVLGFDGGLAHTGYALVSKARDRIRLVEYGLFMTKPIDGSMEVRGDMLFLEIRERLRKMAAPDLASIEAFASPRSSQAASKLSHSIRAIRDACLVDSIEVESYTAKTIRRCLGVPVGADKVAVGEHVEGRLEGYDLICIDYPKTKRHHIVDAAAAAIVALEVNSGRG